LPQLQRGGAISQVRIIVADVAEAVAFYTTDLGASLRRQFGPAIAIMAPADLTL